MKHLMYVSPSTRTLLELASLPTPKHREVIPVERVKLWHQRLADLHLPSRLLLAKLNYENNVNKNRYEQPAFFIPNHPEGRYFKMAVARLDQLRRTLLFDLEKSMRSDASYQWLD